MPRYLSIVVTLLIFATAARACSLCAGLIQRDSLGREFDAAKIVLFGTLANPRLSPQTDAAPGAGSTDFHVEKVLKGEAEFGKQRLLVVPRYLPVLDPKNPPQSFFFVNVVKDKFDPYLGRTATPALVSYLEGSLPHRKAGRVEALHYYARFLNHPDPTVSDDAFLEFAKSNDEDLGRAARTLPLDLVRGLFKQPRLDPDKLSLFAFLLGSCGNDDDARLLRSLITQSPENARALDGILAGYINLRPKEGWALTFTLLADRKQNFNVRFGAIRAIRFYHGWKPREAHAEIVRGLGIVVADGEIADMAVEDLRQWKMWDLTKDILAQYGTKSHSAPITHRAILRYALCCPLPEASEFVRRVRPREAETIQEIEEGLQFEKQN